MPTPDRHDRFSCAIKCLRPVATLTPVFIVIQALLLASALTLPACSKEKGQIRDVDPTLPNVTPSLRGTIGAECKIRRALPTIISGYGLVVGLDGTGGRIVPERVAASMERELGLRGVGREGTFKDTLLEGRTPGEVLRDPDVAVVVVEAAIPLAAPDGMAFDVRVRALPGSDTTSLEGGVLWTTKMQAGPPAVVGGPQTRAIAEASGEIFTNPFANVTGGPGDLNPREGRVLGGGRVTDPLKLEIVLARPLHSRARAIASAINQRFPEGPRGPGTVAKGVSDAVVEVSAPLEFRDRFLDFVELVRHLPINPDFPERRAQNYTRSLDRGTNRPSELVWALRALGKPAIPFVRDLYDHDNEATRLAALTAGAYLDDPRAGLVLSEIAARPGPRRLDAIDLLGVVEGRPTIDQALRRIVETEDELTLRISAYEALAQRALRSRLKSLLRQNRFADELTDEQLAQIAERSIPPGQVQGVVRVPLADKFVMDVVPFGEPLIYVTQQGRPRVALLGEAATIEKPSFLSIFEGDLLIRAEQDAEKVLLRYNDRYTGRITTDALGDSLAELVAFMAREETPERPDIGLRMSYSEVVGALFAIQNDGGTEAQFATETDRLLAELLAAATATDDDERAVGDEEAEEDADDFNPDAFDPDAIDPRREPQRRSKYIVPIPRDPQASR